MVREPGDREVVQVTPRLGRPTHILTTPNSLGRGRHSECGLLWINEHNREQFVEPEKATCRLCRRVLSAVVRFKEPSK